MATTFSRARKQRIDALVNSGDEGTSLLQDAWARLKGSPLFWVGAVIIGLFLVLAIIGPWIAPHDPGAQLLIGQTSRARNAIAPPQDGFPARRRHPGPRPAVPDDRRRPADPAGRHPRDR